MTLTPRQVANELGHYGVIVSPGTHRRQAEHLLRAVQAAGWPKMHESEVIRVLSPQAAAAHKGNTE